MTPARAAELVGRFGGVPLLVVGDVMLDRFIVGRVTRISPEAPVPIVRFESEHVRLGGAANVAHNLAALGGRVSLVGIVGDDPAAAAIRDRLAAARIDYEEDADASGAVERAIVDRAASLARGAKALVVSDYLKGAITRSVVEALLSSARRASGSPAPVVVDPKIPHLDCYAGAALVTPNHHEAEAATHTRIRTDDDAREAARAFRARAQCDAVLITRGEHGMWLADADGDRSIPATAREVSDVTGAGDTVVATLALALAAGATTTEAAILANHAAGIVVGRFGPATVTPPELLAAL